MKKIFAGVSSGLDVEVDCCVGEFIGYKLSNKGTGELLGVGLGVELG
jgi:hypothetical protein